MSKISERGKARRAQIRADVRSKVPALARRDEVRPALTRPDPKALVLGRSDTNAPFFLPLRARLQHSHVIGTTGSGKSKFLEHAILQDIAAGHGVCVIDPHGNHPDSLYRQLLAWIGKHRGRVTRPVHIVDPNAPTHTVGFNPLALPSEATDLSMIAGTVLEAVSRVWGDEDPDEKPTMTRVLEGTFATLAELGLTLAEAPYLYNRNDPHGIRTLLLSKVTDRSARDLLERLNDLANDARGFDAETIAPLNRLSKFVRSKAIRTIIGQTDNTIDFAQAMDEGHIILVNLSGGDAVHDSDADLLGRLLVRFLFFHAKRRTHVERPFFLYLDECQRYLSGDIPTLLAEARKYGLGAVLSHQYLQQLGKPDEPIRHAVLNCTNFKAVFRLQNPAEAQELAEGVMPLNYETPVHASIRPTVVGHRRINLANESASEQRSTSETRGQAIGDTEAESITVAWMESETEATGVTTATMNSEGESSGTMNSISTAESFGVSSAAVMSPEMGLMTPPTVMSLSSGESAASQSGSSSGMSAMRSRSSGGSQAESTTRGTSRGSSEAHSVMRGRTTTSSIGRGVTQGMAQSKGTSEALEPIYADLPSSFHSKENELSMAADALRALPDGRGFVSFVDQTGRRSGFLNVPLVRAPKLSQLEFEALRTEFLNRSSSAKPATAALAVVNEREILLIASARAHGQVREPADSAGWKEKVPPRKRQTRRTG